MMQLVSHSVAHSHTCSRHMQSKQAEVAIGCDLSAESLPSFALIWDGLACLLPHASSQIPRHPPLNAGCLFASRSGHRAKYAWRGAQLGNGTSNCHFY